MFEVTVSVGLMELLGDVVDVAVELKEDELKDVGSLVTVVLDSELVDREVDEFWLLDRDSLVVVHVFVVLVFDFVFCSRTRHTEDESSDAVIAVAVCSSPRPSDQSTKFFS